MGNLKQFCSQIWWKKRHWVQCESTIHNLFLLFFSLAGFRYLRSLVETILIYKQFNKPGMEQPAPKQELVDFWMDFLVEATKKDVSSVRFPVSNPSKELVNCKWCSPGSKYQLYYIETKEKDHACSLTFQRLIESKKYNTFISSPGVDFRAH